MPVQGPQQPGFYLPGAEYLSLAPNTSIALQGRRRRSFTSALVNVPADNAGVSSINQTIENPFIAGNGIYLHDVWLQFNPADASGELQILGSTLSVTLDTADPFGYTLGTPTSTLVSPASVTVLQRDQDKFITQRDLVPMVANPGSRTLQIAGNLAVTNNDPSVPHGFTITCSIVYALLNGIQE